MGVSLTLGLNAAAVCAAIYGDTPIEYDVGVIEVLRTYQCFTLLDVLFLEEKLPVEI